MRFRLEAVEECASSQELLLARRGEPGFHGAAVLALRQTAGFGRRGRSWSSGQGNLALSIGIELPSGAPLIPQLSFFAGLALHEATARLLPPGADLRLKWPNDLFLSGRKLAGLLVQARQGAERTELVLGVGLNLAEVPAGFEGEAAALAELVAPVPSPEELARNFLALLGAELERPPAFASLRERWERAARLHEGPLYVLGESEPVRARELLPTGELLVSDASGGPRKLSSEEVSLRFAPTARAP